MDILRPETKTDVGRIALHDSPKLTIFQHQNGEAAGARDFQLLSGLVWALAT